MRKRTRARECALQILYALDICTGNSQEIIESYWQQNQEEKAIKEFASILISGVINNLKNIDLLITKYTDNWRIERMAVIDRNIIRMAAHELLFVDDIPPKVSINEAVELAKKFGDDESGRFVNGILDKINKAELH